MVIWILFICSLLIFATSLGSIFLGRQSRRWPSTTGKVLSSELREAKTNAVKGCRPFLAYEFSVDGARRRSTSIGYYVGGLERKWAEGLLVGRQEGSDIRVYYHPWMSPVAVVEPGVQQLWAWLALAVIGAFVALNAGVVLFSGTPYLLVDSVFGFVRRLFG